MERPEILEILIGCLHCPPPDEQRVAYAFLREIAVRRDEPLTRRSRVALHLGLYQTQRVAIRVWNRIRKAVSSPYRLPRRTESSALSLRYSFLQARRSARLYLMLALIVTANAYFRAWNALVAYAVGISTRIRRACDTLIDTAAGTLSVIAYGSRQVFAAVNAVYTAILGTAKAATGRTRKAVVSTFAAIRNAVHASYTGLIRTVLGSFNRVRDAIHSFITRVTDAVARIRNAVTTRYFRTRDAVALFIARIIDRVTRAYRFTSFVWSEIKRHAARQVLPQGATPLIAAALVCLVLFVFGINSYFVVSDVNKKGVFIDLSRYEWGDEALASILIGEGYDIYLNQKITEKRIRELLASGHYYERVIRVTGYYSPLPDQEKYATGSYRGDILLNGRGVMGSDTTPVYIGMAAGPPHMEFGTNVIIEDLGKFDLPKIYTVHDRGGAIQGNRLDIWVGKGEEAMEKAYKITGYYKVIVVGDR